MKTLAFSPAALADLDSIWDFSADRWSIDQADRYIDEMVNACHDLAANRKAGRAVEIRQGYKRYGVGSHVIYYRETKVRLDVIRILHGRMDADRHI
ncbi:MAG: type II toxin-antitoxin system RelE/ParE family toxin [Rhizobiaceae bacterium]|nr:type II toxin-antitoxin system RelE/ParE family toxin [Rhizobiaceae bacterium]